MNSKNPEINPANFPALRAFLRGYFHEDVSDEYGTPPEAAQQFYQDADPEERTAVARNWQQVVELTGGSPSSLNAALKKLGSAIRLQDEEIPEVASVFARCLKGKAPRRAAKE